MIFNKKNFKKTFVDFFLTVLIRGSGAPIAFIANIFIARLLGAQKFGDYIVLLSAAYLVGGITVFGTNRVLIREVASSQHPEKQDILLVGRWGISRVLLFSFCGALLVYLWFHTTWANLDYNEFAGIVAAALLVPASASVIIVSAFMVGMGNVKFSQAISDPIRNILLLSGCLLIFYLRPSDEIGTLLFIQIATFLISSIIGWKWIRYKSNAPPLIDYWHHQASPSQSISSKIKNYRIASWYFFLGSAGTLVLNRIDILVVNALSDSTIAGYYGAAVRVGQVAAIVILAGSIWLQPQIAQHIKTGDRKSLMTVLKHGSSCILAGSSFVVICLFIWADFIVSWLGPGFGVVAYPLRLVGFGYFLWAIAVPLYAYLLMSGGEAVIASILWFQVASNLLLHFLLVPKFGVIGAAWAWTGGMAIVSAMTLWWGLQRLMKNKFKVSE